MKKTLLKGLALAAVGSVLLVGNAFSAQFSFGGYLNFTDTNSDGFKETLNLGTSYTDLNGVTINWATLTLDETPANFYNFSPTTYSGGFELWSGGIRQIVADLTFEELIVTSATASINSALVMNLTNITVDGYMGGSTTIDEFLSAPGAATNVTLNAGSTFASMLTDMNQSYGSFYSGNATTVPEPATMLLFGAGLTGLAGLRRRADK